MSPKRYCHKNILLPKIRLENEIVERKTSTSPSGRHLGHYKALVSIINRSLKGDKITELNLIHNDIKICYLGFIRYCVYHWYSLKRWKIIINMMIYKVPGNVKIHRLQVIHFYEADQSALWGENRVKACSKPSTLKY